MKLPDNIKGVSAIVIAAAVVIAVAAFYLGHMTIGTKETVRYVKGDVIRDTVRVPVPYNTVTPPMPHYIFVENTQTVDTAAIIADWIKERAYNPVLFDDKEHGKLTLDLSVQYNGLQSIKYEYMPVYKEVTRYRERVFVPFAAASYSTLGIAGVGGGFFIKNLGVEYQWQRSLSDSRTFHQIGLKWKF